MRHPMKILRGLAVLVAGITLVFPAFTQSLIAAYRQVDGEVDPELLKTGFIIADQMRQEEREQNPNAVAMPKSGNVSPADHLESSLTGELARDNFSQAMKYVRSLPDTVKKLACYLAITNALQSGY